MTSAPITQRNITQLRDVAGDRPALRLRLKPQAPTTGYVDGAWWPRSRDLVTELPALVAVLQIRLGRVERVSYNLTAWGPTERTIEVDGLVVRLAGYRSQHPDTVDVIGPRQQLTLLVVPPESSAQAAHRALMAAGRLGNTDPVEDLLRPDPLQPPVVRGGDEPEDEQRWELESGHLRAGV